MHTFSEDKYGPKVDAFAVLLDASASMGDRLDPHWFRYWEATKEITIAKEFVSRMAQNIPEFDFQGALRTFGHHPDVSKEKTALFFGPAPYSRAGFEKGLSAVTEPGGNTYMAEAIDAAGKDLAGAKGKVAVVIVSDGKQVENAVSAAKSLKETYGDNLCIYSVMVGDDPRGKAFMDQLAKIGQCGSSVNALDAMSTDAMADFVENVLLEEYQDSDGDGVLDPFDECPGTPKGVKVDEKGCPLPKPVPKPARLDSDGDGVYDDQDECPNTPAGAKVDERGCWVIGGILFGFDKYEIKPQYYSILNKAANALKENPSVSVVIEGHTDNVGSAAYNKRLSERRAQAIKNFFIKAGVDSYRMKAVGYGFSKPAASNETEEGRAKNRRVELTPVF